LEGGFEVDAARSSSQPGFNGVIAELVDSMQSRLWQVTAPSLTSERRSTKASAFVSDRFAVASRGSLDVGARYERLTASADGAAQDIAWSTFLPRAAFHWTLSDARAVQLFVGAAQSAYDVPLDVVAWGDPGLDLEHTTDDQTLHVASLIVPTSPYRVDDLLTNAPDRSARRLGAELTAEVINDRLYLLFGATALAAEGVAASRGFESREND